MKAAKHQVEDAWEMRWRDNKETLTERMRKPENEVKLLRDDNVGLTASAQKTHSDGGLMSVSYGR